MADVQWAAVLQRVLDSEQRAREAEQRARDAEAKVLIMERAMSDMKSRNDSMREAHLGQVSRIVSQNESITSVVPILKLVDHGPLVPILGELADCVTRHTDAVHSRCTELAMELQPEANAPNISQFEH